MNNSIKKVSEDNFNEIKLLYSSGYTTRQLSKKFDVSQATISRYLNSDFSAKGKKLEPCECAMIAILYNNGYKISNIAREFNVNRSSINRTLKRNNINIRTIAKENTKYDIIESFFDNIDSQQKAYFLGFLYADGCLSDRSDITIQLHEKDKDILFKLRDLISPNRTVSFFKTSSGYKQHNCCRLSFTNKHIASKLIEWGCTPRKSLNIKFPKQLNGDLYRHFIRGFFDGDGCVCIFKRKDKFVASINFTCGSDDFLNSLKNILGLKLNIGGTISKKYKDKNYRQFSFGGNIQVLNFLTWIYKDATIYMNRKHDNFLKLKDIMLFQKLS